MKVYLAGLETALDSVRTPLRDSLQARTVETVYLRSNWLEGKDRFLMELVYGRGVPIGQLAGLMGISTRSVRRRIRTLTRRLSSPEYLFCLANKEKFSRLERDILRRHCVQGFTIIQTARHCQCSRHMVYGTLRKVRSLIALRRCLTQPALRRVWPQDAPGAAIRLEPIPQPQKEAR